VKLIDKVPKRTATEGEDDSAKEKKKLVQGTQQCFLPEYHKNGRNW
jgi:hypothetical protein